MELLNLVTLARASISPDGRRVDFEGLEKARELVLGNRSALSAIFSPRPVLQAMQSLDHLFGEKAVILAVVENHPHVFKGHNADLLIGRCLLQDRGGLSRAFRP